MGIDFLPKMEPNNDFLADEDDDDDEGVCVEGEVCVGVDVGDVMLGFLLVEEEEEEDLSFLVTGVIET